MREICGFRTVRARGITGRGCYDDRIALVRIGIHTFTRGSLENAALRAVALGVNTFQIFSSSPRMWRYPPLKPDEVRKIRQIREKHDLRPLAIHDSYLINLAATDPVIRQKSIASFREELERAVAIGAEYLVTHPGSYRGQPCEEGISKIVEALKEAGHGIRGVTLLLENTAGAGCAIGSRFLELAAIRQLVQGSLDLPVGYCLDTCHCYVSGYDVSTADGLRDTIREAEKILGLENIPVIHTNDSKGTFQSKLDRHANIGEGHIGVEGFRRILNHPKLREKAFILETPVDQEGDDFKNVQTLKSLCRNSRTNTKR
jgi:deoxyribonuclease-4